MGDKRYVLVEFEEYYATPEADYAANAREAVHAMGNVINVRTADVTAIVSKAVEMTGPGTTKDLPGVMVGDGAYVELT